MPLVSAIGKHVKNVAALLQGGQVAFVQQKMALTIGCPLIQALTRTASLEEIVYEQQ